MTEEEMREDVTITLPRGAWHLVISLLGKASWETVNPLILAIRQQLQNGHAPPLGVEERRPDA